MAWVFGDCLCMADIIDIVRVLPADGTTGTIKLRVNLNISRQRATSDCVKGVLVTQKFTSKFIFHVNTFFFLLSGTNSSNHQILILNSVLAHTKQTPTKRNN